MLVGVEILVGFAAGAAFYIASGWAAERNHQRRWERLSDAQRQGLIAGTGGHQ